MILQAIWKNEFKGQEFTNSLAINMNNYINNKNNWNLEYLQQQGVFLYNPTLTVEKGNPNSHKGIWKEFAKAVVSLLKTQNNIIWMLWGNDAKDIAGHTLPRETKHLTLFNEHPAAASYSQRVWECDHFSKCNEFLKNNNLTEIEWLQR